MPVVNPLARELVFKIVYYGPGLGGKTTTLQHIHATVKPEHRGKMVSLATPVDRTLYFDFLPIRIPTMRGMGVRLQLFTVPGQVYYNATRKLVLTGADGVVLVVDSQRLRADASLESLENLRENLREHGHALINLPHVIQYNKRDLSDLSAIDELERKFNRHGCPSFGTVATRGDGVYESLEAITRAVVDDFERRMPEARGAALHELELPEGGLTEALRRVEGEMSAQSKATLAAPPSGPVLRPSGELRLSNLPEGDPGEDAARAVALLPKGAGPDLELHAEARSLPPVEKTLVPTPISLPPSTHVTEPSAGRADTPPSPEVRLPRLSTLPAQWSFDALWPASERALVRELEHCLTVRDYGRAVATSEQLVARALASAASVLGSTPDAPRDPAVVALLLGIQGRRYLEFRALVRDERGGREIAQAEALAAYALAIEMRLARSRVGA